MNHQRFAVRDHDKTRNVMAEIREIRGSKPADAHRLEKIPVGPPFRSGIVLKKIRQLP